MSKGDETREAILGGAASLASRVGLEALTIGGLAAEMGMSKSGLFAHFGAKEALQRAVMEHVAEVFVDEVVRPALVAPRGEPRIRLLFENWLRWTTERYEGGCPFVQVSAEYDDRPGPLRDYLVEVQTRWLDLLEEAARRAVDEGHFRSDLDPGLFAFEFHSLTLGYHHTTRMMNDPQADARVRAAFEALLVRSRA